MRNRTRIIAAALLALSVGTPGSSGQAASPTQFTLRQLERQPGTVLISPGYITIIEFPDIATRATSGNPALIKVQPRKSSNVVEMTAAKLSGQTDLVVTTGGKIVLFVIKIDPEGKAPRRYTVTGQSAPALPDTSRSAAPPVAATPAPRAVAATTGNRYEAEAAILYRVNPVNNSQASRGQLVEVKNAQGRVTFPTIRAPRAGSYTLRITFANGTGNYSSHSLMVNGVAAPDVRYPSTGNWSSVGSVDVTVNLRAGLNSVRFGQSGGSATLDAVELLGASGSVLASAQTASALTAQAAATTRSTQRQIIPVPNGAFETDLVGWNGGFATDLVAWSAWQGPAGIGAPTIGTQGARSGGKYLVLSNPLPRQQNIFQTISGLSSGTYTLEMWIRTSGGLKGLTLFASDYGGKDIYAGVPMDKSASWVRYSLPDIPVTTGQVKVGIWSSTPGGMIWAHVDDVALYREADQP